MDKLNFISIWINAVIHPQETFQKEKSKLLENKKAMANKIMIYYILGFLIAYLIGWAGLVLLGKAELSFLILAEILPLVLGGTVVIMILNWFMQVIARLLLGGQRSEIGVMGTQAYLTSIFFPPLLILFSIATLIPIEMLSLTIKGIIFVYGLYLLTLSLKESHQYSTTKAVITWIIVIIIIAIEILIEPRLIEMNILPGSIKSFIPEYFL